ncbi:hypothetical protein DPMN_091198 [Dreissena polymorpha]|uniref:Uncharacterized protein n=1 Tax=Dreissena polymorpha TaxID=45954 RepID=A0A9D4KZL8_DREPO|nr:hypothetical protein DPMN_091198 [Dreissena polymorpha]
MTTRDLLSLYLMMKLMELLVWPSLQSPWQFLFGHQQYWYLFFDRVAPSYLKLVTPSSFSPFMVVSALVLVVLFTIIFDFSMLTSIL